MRTLGSWGLFSLLLAGMAAQAQPSPRRDGDLKEGAAAPDFAVKDVDGKKTVKLSGLTGKPVVLIFGSCT
jgi:cytochrome oxidase Cu insertion factor (SCO1/SenC/PrrC family)